MTDKLLCPFCQQELKELYNNGISVGFRCKNKNCPETNIMCGTKEIWEALINERQHATDCQDLFIEAIAQKLEIETELDRTKKQLVTKCNQLEIAVDALKRLEKELYFNNAKQTGHIADSVMSIPSIALEQITALEQKD